MSKLTCTRRLTFCAGHRVLGHEGKCSNPHGHNYTVFITAEGNEENLDSIGRVIDFSVLKQKIGGWIEANWDHQFLIYEEDHSLISYAISGGWNKYILPENPTAENLAEYLLRVVCPLVLQGLGITVTKVVLYETENCSAEATLPPMLARLSWNLE